MVHGGGGDADIGISVVRQHRIAAVGVAGPARKIAAGDVDLYPVAGGEGVMDVAELDGQALDLTRNQVVGHARTVAVHRPHNAVHQQHGAPVGVEVDQLGDKVGVGAA